MISEMKSIHNLQPEIESADFRLAQKFRTSNPQEFVVLHRVSLIAYRLALSRLAPQAAQQINAIVLGGAHHG